MALLEKSTWKQRHDNPENLLISLGKEWVIGQIGQEIAGHNVGAPPDHLNVLLVGRTGIFLFPALSQKKKKASIAAHYYYYSFLVQELANHPSATPC